MRYTHTKNIIITALLLGIGLILHQITPALGLPMQPDFALAMLLIILILNKSNYKLCLVAGIITGIFTAMTTKFPGGQLPNIIDKLVTVNIMFFTLMLINKIKVIKNSTEEKRKRIEVLIIFPLGTLISGIIFLGSANLIVGLPVTFNILFLTIVLPSVILNLIVGVVLFKIIRISIKRSVLN